MNEPRTGSAPDHRRVALDAIPPVERETEDGELRITRAFRGLSVAQAIGYLESLGGEQIADETVEGPGWKASLSHRRETVGPSYRLTTVRITWTGDPDAVDSLVADFRLKAFRASG